MITVTLSKITDENEVVWKNPTNETDVSCELMNTDILAPVIKVSYDYAFYNYAYIPEFKRYYYVERPETLAGTHVLLQLKVDVLMTYKVGIDNCDCVCERNEYLRDPKINDPYIPFEQKHEIQVFNIGNPFKINTLINDKCYIVALSTI